jgi:hypothetical protein
MIGRSLKKYRTLLIVAIVLSCLAGWRLYRGPSGDFERRLPGGYSVTSSNRATICLTPPERFAFHESNAGHGVTVARKISAIAISNGFIVGHVEPSPHSEVPIEVPGYFIVDWRTGEARLGLGRDECAEALRQHGLAMPRLRHPNTRWKW